jgi:hypothetical protein
MISWKLLLLALLIMASPVAEAAKLISKEGRFSYSGYIGGLKIGTSSVDVASDNSKYAVELKMKTGGVIGWFVEWLHRSSAFGLVQDQGNFPLSPNAYRNQSVWEEKERLLQVIFSSGTANILFANPHPIDDERREPIPEKKRQNTVDPLTALIGVGRMIEEKGTCKSNFDIFDGRRLFQLRIEDKGLVKTSQSRFAPFGGDARRCDFTFKQMAGFKRLKEQKPNKGSFYFRHVSEHAVMMPIKVKAESNYGDLIIHLRNVESIGPEFIKKTIQEFSDTEKVQ